MSKPKKLTMATLNKLDAGLNEKKVVYLADIYGNSHECQVDKKFRKTKVQQLCLEYLDYLTQLKQSSKIDNETLMNITILLYALSCKYFTNLPVEFSTLEGLTTVTKKLLDQGFVDQLFSGDTDKGFDVNEVINLNKELDKIAKNVGQVVGEMAFVSALDVVANNAETGEDNNGE